jgi:hypothetical protein
MSTMFTSNNTDLMSPTEVQPVKSLNMTIRDASGEVTKFKIRMESTMERLFQSYATM